jgi:hypothetical protein
MALVVYKDKELTLFVPDVFHVNMTGDALIEIRNPTEILSIN